MIHFTTDIDECETDIPCSSDANCFNTEGGFNCSCLDGFQGDGIVCEGKGLGN